MIVSRHGKITDLLPLGSQWSCYDLPGYIGRYELVAHIKTGKDTFREEWVRMKLDKRTEAGCDSVN